MLWPVLWTSLNVSNKSSWWTDLNTAIPMRLGHCYYKEEASEGWCKSRTFCCWVFKQNATALLPNSSIMGTESRSKLIWASDCHFSQQSLVLCLVSSYKLSVLYRSLKIHYRSTSILYGWLSRESFMLIYWASTVSHATLSMRHMKANPTSQFVCDIMH